MKHNIDAFSNILDVTLRDGGYKNNFNFSIQDITNIINFLREANVKYVEVGYRNGTLNSDNKVGITGISSNEYLKYVKELLKDLNLVVMLHPKNVTNKDLEDMLLLGVDFIRVCLPRNIDQHTIEIIKEIKNLKFKFSYNITRITELNLDTLKNILDSILFLTPNVIYLADSNGHLTPNSTREVFSVLNTYKISMGFHAHNNLDLALINTIVALECGVNFIDASIAGLGKGVGNLKLEIFIAYLNLLDSKINKYLLYPVLEAKQYIESKEYYDTSSNIKDMIMGFFNLSQNYVKDLEDVKTVKDIFNKSKGLSNLNK